MIRSGLLVPLFLFLAHSAAAQLGQFPPMSCTTSVSVTPLLQAEGYAEQVGDILLVCSGGSPTEQGVALPTVTFQVWFREPITSRLYQDGWSEALLMIDEPNSGLPQATRTQLACAAPDGNCSIISTGTAFGNYDGSLGHPNVFAGKIVGNSVTFANIPIAATGDANTTRVFRFSNIRVNANAYASPDSTPVPVIAALSVSNAIHSINNVTPVVGFVSPGLSPSFRSTDDTGAGVEATVNSCSAPQRIGVLRFEERFGTAFRVRTYAAFADGDTSPAPAAQEVPGLVYQTESGLYSPTLTSPNVDFSTAGLADSGTRLRVTFVNIPDGTRVWVGLRNAIFSGGNPTAAESGTVARLISGQSTSFAPVAATTTLDGVPAAELTVSNGSATAVWEVLAASVNQVDDMDFVVWAEAGNSPAAVSVNFSFAPAPFDFNPADGGRASATLPVPRFIPDSNPAVPIFASAGCNPVSPTATITSITARPFVVAGTPTTLTTTVSAAVGTPRGTVTFFEGSVPLVSAPLFSNGSAAATTVFSDGEHTITAVFSPSDGSFASSTSFPQVFYAYVSSGPPVSGAMICTASTPSGTSAIRADGYTEKISDIAISCAGGDLLNAGAPLPTATIQVSFPTNVTSRIYPGDWSEALLVVDDPGSGMPDSPQTLLACAEANGICPIVSNGNWLGNYDGSAGRPNIFPGKVSGNSVIFTDIPIASAPGIGARRHLRLTNIRVNASGLSSGNEGQLYATISISGAQAPWLANSTINVATVLPGFSADLRSPDDLDTLGSASVTSCSIPQRIGILRFDTQVYSRPYGNVLTGAFKARSEAAFVDADTSPAPIAHDVRSGGGPAETSYYRPELTAPTVDFSTVGLADSGTRLLASLNNVPAGTRIWVSASNVLPPDLTPLMTAGVVRLVAGQSTPFTPVAATATLDGTPAAELTVTNGRASAVWEVLQNPTGHADFVVWAQAGTEPGTALAIPSFAPIPPAFSVMEGASASATLPIPRFAAATSPVFPISVPRACIGPNATATTLSASDVFVRSGQSIAFTAIVAADSGPPTGTVSFREGSVILATVPVSNGAAVSNLTLPTGTHTITAVLAPGGGLNPSTSSPVTVIVQPALRASASISLASNLVPSTVGQAVIFTATITPNSGSAVPTGTVRLSTGLRRLERKPCPAVML